MDDAVVRRSRAIGLPASWPDIQGLAVRLHHADGDADLLFASTGWGRSGRFVLTASRHPTGRPLTTLLPYDTDSGPVLLGALGQRGSDSYDLYWARPRGDWQPFGVLLLGTTCQEPEISFDPLRRQLDGLRQYPAVNRLREPAYLRARESRS